jgi:hypothetical protein
MKRSPMTRTGFNARTSGLKATSFKRSERKEATAVKRMKTGKKPPTAAERDWMDFVANFGCVVCWQQFGIKTPCAVHHIVVGGRRKGHMFTIGLCDPGHHQNAPITDKISRHPWKARFESAYGTEDELHTYMLKQYEEFACLSTA